MDGNTVSEGTSRTACKKFLTHARDGAQDNDVTRRFLFFSLSLKAKIPSLKSWGVTSFACGGVGGSYVL